MNRIFVMVVMVTLLLANLPAFALDSLNVRRLGQIAEFNELRAVAVQGDYAYCAANDGGMVIFNIANLASPQQVGRCASTQWPNVIAVSGNYAYTSDTLGTLRVFNVSNPASPYQVGAGSTWGSGRAYDIKVRGNYVYLTQTGIGMRVFNVSNPAAPTHISSYASGGNCRSIAFRGDYALLTVDNSLYSINIANPVSPLFSWMVTFTGQAYDVAVSGDGNYAYVTNGSNGVRVINTSNPAHPTLAGTFDTPGNATSVAASGNTAYVSEPDSGLRIIDFTNPSSPVIVGCWNAALPVGRLAVSGNHLFLVTASAACQIIDISDPSAPFVTKSFGAAGWMIDVAMRGDYAYAVSTGRALTVFNFSNPAALREVASYGHGFSGGRSIVLDGDFAYVTTATHGLSIIRISDPTAPLEVSDFCLPSSKFCGVSVQDGYAFVADSIAGLRIFDVHDPALPNAVGLLPLASPALNVTVGGSFAYVSCAVGMRIVNVSNPATPVIVSTYGGAYFYPRDIVVEDGLAYIAHQSGLAVVNVSDPAHPAGIGSLSSGDSRAVVLAGHLIYLASSESGLRVGAIGNSANPSSVGYYDTPGYSRGVAVSGSLVCVADYRYFGVYDCSVADTCSAPQLGTLQLLQTGPPAWGYRLTRESGCLSNLAFWGFGEGLDPSISSAAPAPWIVSASYRSRIEFSYPQHFLMQGAVDTFWLRCPTCFDSTIGWSSGSIRGLVNGPIYDIPLPVELLSFAATPGDAQVTLSWRTASEQNNDHFEIERDGAVVARMNGQGNSSTESRYHWTDTSLSNGQRYRYTLYGVSISGQRDELQTVESSPQPGTALITEYALHDAYPNPFNPTTTLTFDLPEGGLTRIEIFNLNGQRVATLVNSPQTAGRHTVQFDASNLPSGMYLARFSAGSYQASRKLLLLK